MKIKKFDDIITTISISLGLKHRIRKLKLDSTYELYLNKLIRKEELKKECPCCKRPL